MREKDGRNYLICIKLITGDLGHFWGRNSLAHNKITNVSLWTSFCVEVYAQTNQLYRVSLHPYGIDKWNISFANIYFNVLPYTFTVTVRLLKYSYVSTYNSSFDLFML